MNAPRSGREVDASRGLSATSDDDDDAERLCGRGFWDGDSFAGCI